MNREMIGKMITERAMHTISLSGPGTLAGTLSGTLSASSPSRHIHMSIIQ